MNIGKYIENLRTDKGLSTRQLGDLSGLNPSTISRIENGNRKPTPLSLRKLSPYLGVSYEQLMNISGYTEPDLTIPSEKIMTEGIIVNMVKELVSKKIIKNETDIPDDVMKLLISAIKLEIKLQCENFHCDK